MHVNIGLNTLDEMTIEELHHLIRKLDVRQNDLEKENKDLHREVDSLKEKLEKHSLEDDKIGNSLDKYKILFDSMTQGILYQDADGNILTMNPAAERILGLSLQQIEENIPYPEKWNMVHEDGSNFKLEEYPLNLALKQGKEIRNVVLGFDHPDRENKTWLNVHAVPLFKQGEKTPYQVYRICA